MNSQTDSFLVLMAEDDEDDRLLIRDAVKESGQALTVTIVADGEEVIDYLHQTGRFEDTPGFRLPNLILLDLNMPRKDGRETLAALKSDPALRQIPVVMFTTSNDPLDIAYCYDLGANSFITKPVHFDELVKVFHTLSAYWFGIVSLPRVE